MKLLAMNFVYWRRNCSKPAAVGVGFMGAAADVVEARISAPPAVAPLGLVSNTRRPDSFRNRATTIEEVISM